MAAPHIVLELGTSSVKLGFAGNVQPTYVLPTVLAIKQADASGMPGGVGGLSSGGGGPGAAGGSKSGNSVSGSGKASWCLEDLSCCVGEDALNNAASGGYTLTWPIRQSMVEDFNALERLCQQCIFQYLRVEPEDHCVTLAEPHLGHEPSTRQQLAEIMFETFGVAGLHMVPQAVLSMYATAGLKAELAAASASNGGGGPGASLSWQGAAQRVLSRGLDPYGVTGVVADVGEGSTSVVPVVNGFVLRSCARSVGVGGRDLTQHMQQAIRACGAGVPPDMTWEVARKVKETHCYVCADPGREPHRLAARAAAGKGGAAKTWTLVDPRAGNAVVKVPLGQELFMAPELLFTCAPTLGGGGVPPPPTTTSNAGGSATPPPTQAAAAGLQKTGAPLGPPSASAAPTRNVGGWQPLPTLVDQVVQQCPIDMRRPLYASVALSGGTSGIRNFARRVHAELSHLANARLPAGAKSIEVDVSCGPWSEYASWLGGSLMAGGATPEGMLQAATTSRAHWQEHGSLLGADCIE